MVFFGGGALHSIHALIHALALKFGPVWSGASPGIGSQLLSYESSPGIGPQLLSYESEGETEVHEQSI